MQIHELNNYNGSLDSNSFVAVDNGSDTGKIGIPGLLKSATDEIAAVNARVDNIIAGGTAPSAAEVTDARLGANGETYASLGGAIRGQIESVEAEINSIIGNGTYTLTGAESIGYRTISLGRTIKTGTIVKITNNGSQPILFFFEDGTGTRQNVGTINRSATVTVQVQIDAVNMYVYLNEASYNIVFSYGDFLIDKVNNLSKIKQIGNGFFTNNGGTYAIYNSAYFRLWGIPVDGGQTVNIHTYLTAFSSMNRVHVVGLNTVLDSDTITAFTSSMVEVSSEVETSRSDQGDALYTITLPTSVKFLVIAQSIIGGTPPYIEEIPDSRNYEASYSDLKSVALDNGLTILNGKISAGSSAGSFSFVLYDDESDPSPLIIKAQVSYTGNAPSLNVTFDNTYKSVALPFVNNVVCDQNEFRLPPFDCGGNKSVIITVNMPVGSEISRISVEHEGTTKRKPIYDGINLNSHLGFYRLCPENTIPAFVAAYRSGYQAIICNPKLTSDKEWVCIHDLTINRTGRQSGGGAISSTLYVENLTLAQLETYDFGIYFNNYFAGVKIPTVEEFLKICAITGMTPIFSMHDVYSDEDLQSLKALVDKYGLINSLVLKIPSVDGIETYYRVFGHIGKYDLVVDSYSAQDLDNLAASSLFGREVLMIDYPGTVISQAIAEDALDHNIICGVYDLAGTLLARYRELIEYGVTEFTDDTFCLNGLKWY